MGGGFRNEPYNGGLKFPKKPGVPDSFRSYFTAIRKAGILGEARVSEDGQVYINNLPADTTDHDIYKLFSAFGPIMANGARAMLNPDGTCKGFGFVDFFSPQPCSSRHCRHQRVHLARWFFHRSV